MTKKKIQTEPLAVEAPIEEPQNEVKEDSTEEEHVEKPVEEVKSDTGRKTKSTTKSITCPNCKKTMLEKTFKYYHSLKCHPEPTNTKQTEVKQAPPLQQSAETEARHIVEFGFGQRMQARKDKYTNLFSNAI